MRVLLVHNHYRRHGGEDVAFAAESRVLRRYGHEVGEVREHNDRIARLGRLHLAAGTIWSLDSRRRLAVVLRDFRPDVVHFHNTFPLISPSAYAACRAAGAPVVQTLANYRLLCPGANFVRDGRPCEACTRHAAPWPGVLHRCYRGSAAATATVAAMLVAHRAARTWSRMVDVFVAPTEFARRKFVDGGLPGERIRVKPNVVDPDPGPGRHEGGFALFAGRLSREKGVATLLRAWELLGAAAPPLKVVGTGPLAPAPGACTTPRIEWLGWRPRDEVLALMRDAAVLVFPSHCYESFGLALAEAFATGLPVIASRLGAMAELVEHGRTGWLFEPGDAAELAAAVTRAFADGAVLRAMGRAARAAYEERYTAERNHALLMEIYRAARAAAAARGAGAGSAPAAGMDGAAPSAARDGAGPAAGMDVTGPAAGIDGGGPAGRTDAAGRAPPAGTAAGARRTEPVGGARPTDADGEAGGPGSPGEVSRAA
ncbi:MAG TPA: glycosyltransferase [Longimicrobiales bacterium]